MEYPSVYSLADVEDLVLSVQPYRCLNGAIASFTDYLEVTPKGFTMNYFDINYRADRFDYFFNLYGVQAQSGDVILKKVSLLDYISMALHLLLGLLLMRLI